jgi:23S rRNA pseudouridine1911/1915/1917 synthase
VTPAEAGERIDRMLAARELGHSRSTLQRWIVEERVRVDGRPVPPKHRVRAGEHVEIVPAPPPATEARPEDLPLEILHCDDHLLVVNKPAGLVVHPGPGHASGTLVNAVLFHAPVHLGDGDNERPGIVHRLDKDTSGVMVVARSLFAKNALVARFKEHDIERRYVAIATGVISAARTIDRPIGRHPTDRKRFSSKIERGGKRAVTHVEPRERLHGATLVECRLETGRTHQIRVHLADEGHALLGDRIYGRAAADAQVRAAAAALGRQALHAKVLGFEHPATGEPLRFETEPPADFMTAVEALRSQ